MSDINQLPLDQIVEGFEYLDDLRSSGVTNMFGAGPYIVRDLGYSKDEARIIHSSWMDTFDGDTSAYDRATKLLETFE